MLCADVKPKKGKKENVPKTIGASINANAKTTNAKAKVFTRIWFCGGYFYFLITFLTLLFASPVFRAFQPNW
jgi:hypothetical protein